MIKFFQHKYQSNIYIFNYIQDLDIQTALKVVSFTDLHFAKGSIKLISIVNENAHLTDFGALLTLAKSTKTHENNVLSVDTFGLKGIQNTLYKLFIKTSKSSVVQRVSQTIIELEELHSIKIFDDFNEVMLD